MYRTLFKPFSDFICALLALIVLSPLFIIVTIGLAIVNNGNPFFFQHRPGKYERIFTIIKFKTMNDRQDVNGQLLPDALRLTTMGNFVRKTSLDELPQLLNVLKGAMSFVGPRPLLPEYLPLYSPEQRKRHDVKPGITGWAQVNGRNGISWEQKFELDVWYVKQQSFLVDLKILFKTIKKVIQSENISAEGHETMPTLTEHLKRKNKL